MTGNDSTSSGDHFNTGVLFVLLATLGWSLSGLFVKLMPHLSGWQINCWRGYWLAVALLVYLVLQYGSSLPKAFRSIPRAAFWSSALCFAMGTTFYVSSLTFTNTSTVAVIGAMSPLITAVLSPWITGEKLNLFTLLAAIIAVIGAGYIGWSGFQSGNVIGIVLAFGVPFTFALQTLLLRRYRSYDMMPAICAGGFVAFLGAGLVPLAFTASGLPQTSGFNIDLPDMALLMLMGPCQLALPLVFYARSARSVPAVLLSLLSMLDALLNPLWPWLFLGETITRPVVVGGLIILSAVLISIFGGHVHAYARRLSTR
jgi:drug/metabolite transporter, DME family